MKLFIAIHVSFWTVSHTVIDVWKGIHVPINALNIILTHFEAMKNNKFILVNGPDIHNNINE